MSISNRAAQFIPFDALTGYYDEVRETVRLTMEKTELSDNEKERRSYTTTTGKVSGYLFPKCFIIVLCFVVKIDRYDYLSLLNIISIPHYQFHKQAANLV